MTDEADANLNLPPDERRTYDRARLIVDLHFNGDDATGVASTKDISPGGLYMNTQTVLPEGSILTLRLPFGEHHVVVNAEVVYSSPGQGVGVRFRDLTEQDRLTIERELADQQDSR